MELQESQAIPVKNLALYKEHLYLPDLQSSVLCEGGSEKLRVKAVA